MRNLQILQFLYHLIVGNVVSELSIKWTTVRNKGSGQTNVPNESLFRISQFFGSFVPPVSFIRQRIDQFVGLVDFFLLFSGLFFEVVFLIIISLIEFVEF